MKIRIVVIYKIYDHGGYDQEYEIDDLADHGDISLESIY